MLIWKQHPDLIARLADAQNHDANINRDVMTWAAFCDTREALERHVVSCETKAAQYQPQRMRKRVGA